MTDQSPVEKAAETAAAEYRKVQPRYEELASTVAGIIEQCLAQASIPVHEIQHRAKDVESFRRKAAQARADNPDEPKYSQPLTEITDLAAVRVISYVPSTIPRAEQLLREEFEVVERTDKAAILHQEDRFGYQSIHLLARLSGARTRLREYSHLTGMIFEVQLRTILQHAWAEIEHDIRYKSPVNIPPDMRRRFAQVAGLLEIADRAFQAIQDEDEARAKADRAAVLRGALTSLALTPDALRAYLDHHLGPDGRMSRFSYEYETQALRTIGFDTVQEVEDCLHGIDADAISRIVWGNRQGQLNRFMDSIMLAMGEEFIVRHHLASSPWFVRGCLSRLALLAASGLKPGAYRPARDVRNAKTELVRELMACVQAPQTKVSDLGERILNLLPARDAKLIRLTFGAEGGKMHSDAEVASMFGMPEWAVRNVREVAMRSLEELPVPRIDT